MLSEDAWIGFGVRHQRTPLERTDDYGNAIDNISAEAIERTLNDLYRQDPDVKNITELRKRATEKLGIGRSTLLAKTKYNPLKP